MLHVPKTGIEEERMSRKPVRRVISSVNEDIAANRDVTADCARRPELARLEASAVRVRSDLDSEMTTHDLPRGVGEKRSAFNPTC